MLFLRKRLLHKRVLVAAIAVAALGNAAFALGLGATPATAGQCCRQHSDCSGGELCLPELVCPESPFPGWTKECGVRTDGR